MLGIWIRNQCKEQLHLIESFRVTGIADCKWCNIWGLTTCGVQYKLGIYETNGRALEVLDKIQEFIR